MRRAKVISGVLVREPEKYQGPIVIDEDSHAYYVAKKSGSDDKSLRVRCILNLKEINSGEPCEVWGHFNMITGTIDLKDNHLHTPPQLKVNLELEKFKAECKKGRMKNEETQTEGKQIDLFSDDTLSVAVSSSKAIKSIAEVIHGTEVLNRLGTKFLNSDNVTMKRFVEKSETRRFEALMANITQFFADYVPDMNRCKEDLGTALEWTIAPMTQLKDVIKNMDHSRVDEVKIPVAIRFASDDFESEFIIRRVKKEDKDRVQFKEGEKD